MRVRVLTYLPLSAALYVFCRDIDQSRQFAIQSFAKQLLDVADNLSRAIESVPPEALEKKVAVLWSL